MVFIQVIYDKSKPIPPLISLIAVNLRLQKVGELILTRLTSYSKRYSGSIKSRQSGQGIPKKLIYKANEILQKIANQSGEIITHRVNFTNDDAKEKLTKYYLALNYVRIDQHLVKDYFPIKIRS